MTSLNKLQEVYQKSVVAFKLRVSYFDDCLTTNILVRQLILRAIKEMSEESELCNITITLDCLEKSSKLVSTKNKERENAEQRQRIRMQGDLLDCLLPLEPRRLIFEKSRKIIRACGARRCLFPRRARLRIMLLRATR